MLYVNGQEIAQFVIGGLMRDGETWIWSQDPQVFAVGPEEYLTTVDVFLTQNALTLDDIEGVVVVQGPGSPTALRGVHALVNALAFTRSWPVYGLEKAKEVSDEGILEALSGVQSKPYALPAYGTDPHITKSNKDALKRVVSHGE